MIKELFESVEAIADEIADMYDAVSADDATEFEEIIDKYLTVVDPDDKLDLEDALELLGYEESANLLTELSNLTFDEEYHEASQTRAGKLIEELNEAKFKKVVRGGKIVKKMICPAGYKASNGKCVKMSAKEVRSRSMGAKRAARARKGKSHAAADRSRKLSMRKRASL